MKTYEVGVLENSSLFLHTASIAAKKTFFYPICTGYFYYDNHYSIQRETYDSFLLMLVKKGSCIVEVQGQTFTVSENQILFLDCFQSHAYYTTTGWEALWIHFDGIAAREYFHFITNEETYVFDLTSTYVFEKSIRSIYDTFRENQPLKEAVASQQLTNALTELLVSTVVVPTAPNFNAIEEAILYIKNHFRDDILLDTLANYVSLSPYYFTRLFNQETGFTPHEYIIATRINAAKFLLKNTSQTVKEICYATGFHSESSFCTTFKKWENMTPSTYRTG